MNKSVKTIFLGVSNGIVILFTFIMSLFVEIGSTVVISMFLGLLCNYLLCVIYDFQEGEVGCVSVGFRAVSWILGVPSFAVTVFLSFMLIMSESDINVWGFSLAIFWPFFVSMSFCMYSERVYCDVTKNISPFVPIVSVIVSYVATIPFAFLFTLSWIQDIILFRLIFAILYFLSGITISYFAAGIESLDDLFDMFSSIGEGVSSAGKKTTDNIGNTTLGFLPTSTPEPKPQPSPEPKPSPKPQDSPEFNNKAVFDEVEYAVYKWSKEVDIFYYKKNATYGGLGCNITSEGFTYKCREEFYRSSVIVSASGIMKVEVSKPSFSDRQITSSDTKRITDELSKDILASLKREVELTVLSSEYKNSCTYSVSVEVSCDFEIK